LRIKVLNGLAFYRGTMSSKLRMSAEPRQNEPTHAPAADIYDDGYLRVEHDKYYLACQGRPIYTLSRTEFLIISRLARDFGRPVNHFIVCLAARLQLYVSAAFLIKYEEMLRSPRLAIDPEKVTASLRLIKQVAKTITSETDPDGVA